MTAHDPDDFRPDDFRPDDFAAELREAAGACAAAADWDWFWRAVPEPVQRALLEEFFAWQTHEGQQEPEGDWRVWLMLAGRGFGKTLAGAQWVCRQARETPGARIALVGGSADEVAKVMIEGPSGLLAAARTGEEMLWVPTRGTVRFGSGAEAFVYSAAAAEKLRGPEHHFAWCDELAKWPNAAGPGQRAGQADSAWDNLQMGMRLGTRPRLVVTTTPRPGPLLRRVKALAGTVTSGGRTTDNVHISGAFKAWAIETYGGTRLGRQELDGELLDAPKGTLWPREIVEKARLEGGCPALRRVVIGVDPPASTEGACGIVVCGKDEAGIVYVLADCSVEGLRPEGWARAVARAAEAWEADRVVAEKNQGGDMVESVLRGVESALPVRLVSASRGKAARAEPIATRFETGRARLAGRFPALEDELIGMTPEGYEGPGRSPDRADAMVWAMSDLFGKESEPTVRRL